MKQWEKTMILLTYGSWGYPFLEYLYRGWSHWSMALAGGICFALIGQISDFLSDCRLPIRCFAGASAITCVEFTFGCIFNLGLHMQVWDYSGKIYNLAGQICIQYSLLWLFLCIPLVLLADKLKIQRKKQKNNSLSACRQRKISI